MKQRDWTVTLGGPPKNSVDADEVMEQLVDHAPALSLQPGWVSVTITMLAGTPIEAIARASDLVGEVIRFAMEEAEVRTMEAQLHELERPNLPSLLGVSEAAERLGVSRQRAWQLYRQNVDFPPPAVELKSGPLWLEGSIEGFKDRWPRKTGRPRAVPA